MSSIKPYRKQQVIQEAKLQGGYVMNVKENPDFVKTAKNKENISFIIRKHFWSKRKVFSVHKRNKPN